MIWTANEGELVMETQATTLCTRTDVFWQLTGGGINPPTEFVGPFSKGDEIQSLTHVDGVDFSFDDDRCALAAEYVDGLR